MQSIALSFLLFAVAAPNDARDPRLVSTLTELRKIFSDLDVTLAEAKWGNDSWESSLQRYLGRIEGQIKQIERTWPSEDVRPIWEGVERRKAQIAARGGNAAEGSSGLRDFYQGKAQLVKRAPAEVNAAFMLPTVSGEQVQPSTTIEILAGLDYPALVKRMADDKTKTPKYFYALKNRLQKPAKGQELSDSKTAGLTSQDEEKINEAINTILLWRDKMEAAQGECARAVSMTIAKGDETSHSNEVKMAFYETAGLMARSFKAMFPGNPVFDDVGKEAQRALDRVMQSFAHLFTGPFHKQNVNRIVLFKAPQKPGKENPADVITEIKPGEPCYAIAYFRQTVKEIGATKNDPELGYSVATLPKAFFKESRQDKGMSSSVALYDVGGKDQPALKQAYIVYDLLPNPSTTYKSHLQYLPSLHFVKWLMTLTPGTHDIVFGVDDQGFDDKFAAQGSFRISLDPASKEALKAYYDKLWAKKLTTVVFPDLYGAKDKQAEIPNRGDLAKYGKLIKLSYAQTGQVMKPFPNQNQVNNFVGSGYGLFERADGTYEIIALSFSRQPSEKSFRWTGLGATPSDYVFNGEGYQIKPTLLDYGYEIPKENLGKSASWKQ